jgi:hypothetical protein
MHPAAVDPGRCDCRKNTIDLSLKGDEFSL